MPRISIWHQSGILNKHACSPASEVLLLAMSCGRPSHNLAMSLAGQAIAAKATKPRPKGGRSERSQKAMNAKELQAEIESVELTIMS